MNFKKTRENQETTQMETKANKMINMNCSDFKKTKSMREDAADLTARLAVAVAIARKTPVGMDAESFAQYLANKFRKKMYERTIRVEQLEEELFSLKQDYVILDLRYKATIESSNKTEFLLATQKETQAENTHYLGQDQISSNLMFMENVLALRYKLQSWNGNHGQVLVTSITSTLRALEASSKEMRGNEFLPSQIYKLSSVLKGILNEPVLTNNEEITASVIQLGEELINQIATSNCTGQWQEKLSETVVSLAVNNATRNGILAKLMVLLKAEWFGYIDHEKTGSVFCCYKFESLYFVFWMTERILMTTKKNAALLAVKRELTHFLNDNIHDMYAAFPLLVHYIWKLVAILDIQKSEDEYKNALLPL